MNLLINIVGTTAIGKTALAIVLARHFKTEILSCDSRQFYREMSIGTAVPSREELAAAPHHFIQHKSIFDTYSVGDFEREVMELLPKLFARRKLVIMVGGSGLYNDVILKGLDEFPPIKEGVRESLNALYKEKGNLTKSSIPFLSSTFFIVIIYMCVNRLQIYKIKTN